MAMILEDGTGVVGANGFVSLTELGFYADERNIDLSAFTDAQMNGAIVVSSKDYIDTSFNFKGDKLNEDQGMQIPTDEVELNADIKQAACMGAILHLNGRLFVNPTDISQGGQITMESKSLVTGMDKETQYAEGYQYTTKYPTVQIDRLLSKYIEASVSNRTYFR